MIFSLLVACGGSKSGEPTTPPDVVQPPPDVPPIDAGPITDCTDLPNGTECDDGNPCTSGDSCDGQGSCIGANSTVCPDTDKNPCTNPVCDPKNGDPQNSYCTEVPLNSETVEDVCYRYQCADGNVTGTEPAAQNDCGDWAVPTGGCIDQYVCDPQYEAPQGGSHCRPVGKIDGTPCLNDGVGVKAASNTATEDESSDCLLYVCHQEAGPNTALTTPQCVLSSTLPEDVQKTLEDGGSKLRHVCSVDNAPDAVNTQCNDWKCGCMGDECAQPECQADPKNTMTFKECDNGNACDGSVCLPAKIAGATMECSPPMGTGTDVCDVFPNATCDVSQPCDAETGCPNAMDVDASNANCQINNPCIDSFNTYCAPNDPNAHPETGCVTNFKDPGTACGEALKDACVLAATCEEDGESMKCQVNEYVTCNDGNPCTKDFCTDGQCQTTELPGECDDGNACTENDLCQNAQCVGAPVNCNDGFDCTADSCNEITGCAYLPDDTLCADEQECTANTCVVGVGCQSNPLTGTTCTDGDTCTDNDTCQQGVCVGAAITQESNVCDGVDNDCDGQTDENCSLVLRAQHTGDGQATSQGGGLILRHHLGGPRIFGHTSDGTHTLKSGVIQGAK